MPHDWRDSLRLAADLALLGIVVTVLSLPVVTAGAVVATASTALHHLLSEGRWPSLADNGETFRRRLLPGLLAGPAALAAVALIVVDVAALRRGAVPGGAPALTAVLVVAVLAVGWCGLVAVLAGTADRGAPRAALGLAAAHPVLLLSSAGVLAFAAVLAVLIHPALTPVLAGFALFALHAVTRRLAPAAGRTPAPGSQQS